MELQAIQALVERALADGILSKQESDLIKNAIYSDNKVTPEEARLLRLLNEMVWTGQVALDKHS